MSTMFTSFAIKHSIQSKPLCPTNLKYEKRLQTSWYDAMLPFLFSIKGLLLYLGNKSFLKESPDCGKI